MIVVLDGYNIIKKITHTRQATERERNLFITAVTSYAGVKKLHIELVFDGGLSPVLEKEHHGSVRVIYVGTGKSADDYIKDFMSDHCGQDLLLVSADNELRRYAARLQVDSLTSDEFIAVLRGFLQDRNAQGLSKPAPLKKIAKTTAIELDALMIAGSQMMSGHKDDSLKKPSKRSAKKSSKIEKRIVQKINKL